MISNNEIWVNNIKADGGAYKGCPKNDYCKHFSDSGDRPQNFIRDYSEEKRFLDYPKLNELIKRKNEILNKRATPAMCLKADLKTFDLSSLGKFDVILIDPPWQDYVSDQVKKDQSNTSNTDLYWTYDEIADLKIENISESCSFLFLWVGCGKGLDYGRALLKKWGFRRCEDIVWIKTNKHSTFKKKHKDQSSLLQHTKEHCLVGIKGSVKRGTDRNFIHANIDTDVIVAEESLDNNTEKPHELYRIIERFCLGRKRIELFGEDHNIRSGWLTLGKSISNSNYEAQKYNAWFSGDSIYPEVQGYEGGRYVGTTSEIESLRPRSPVRNNNSSFNGNNMKPFNPGMKMGFPGSNNFMLMPQNQNKYSFNMMLPFMNPQSNYLGMNTSIPQQNQGVQGNQISQNNQSGSNMQGNQHILNNQGFGNSG
eukprot:CAMPEP_0170525056 /NCGR_PEP_ID=MMETSP0209-20121228/10519_1 /TAXON_ID=665100 ORGANISM="Litonotus pictus, Strain P1" /NCGR_SAMPLE_ID=MMETSP0209 /ASSEMBLY_ACC=CAM_ASM_000301 /LENGTH=423 /DNA_ID=CAMNT_0010814097 /DNA_START=93 /DNA_END=1360 /DNA_ORIENTATION=+